MPAAIDDDARSAIVFHAALGYAQQEIAEEVGVSRNTVRKYLGRTREAVEGAEEPREALAAIVRGDYDWDRPERGRISFGDHPM